MTVESAMDAALYYGGLALAHGTALAALSWLLCRTLLRRARPALLAAIWTLVLLKFLFPPVLPGEMAMSGWIARSLTAGSEAPISNDAPSQPRAAASTATAPVRAGHLGLQTARALFPVYLLIVALLGIRLLLAHRRARRRISQLPAADAETAEEVQMLALRIGLARAPDVRAALEGMIPCVTGLRRPVLVLPRRLMRAIEPPERRALILHELAHLRRRDELGRYLQGIAGVLFFFFPPVRWVCRRIEHLTEMACDRWAVSVSGIDPALYAEALVSVVREMNGARRGEAGLALMSGAERLEERLDAVMSDAGSAPRLSPKLRLAIAGWAVFALAGGSAGAVQKAAVGEMAAEPAGEARRSSASHWPETAAGAGQKRSQAAVRTSRPRRPRIDSRGLRAEEPARSTENRALSSWEEGFLLGRRYAESRNGAPSPAGVLAAEAQAKRETELRMQRLRGLQPRQ